jgi:hypothetical protein
MFNDEEFIEKAVLYETSNINRNGRIYSSDAVKSALNDYMIKRKAYYPYKYIKSDLNLVKDYLKGVYDDEYIKC